MNPPSDAMPIAQTIVDAAIGWYVRQSSGTMSSSEQARLATWLAEHPDHNRAWQRLQRMGEQLQGSSQSLAPKSSRAILHRLSDLERRKALRLLSIALVSGGSLYLGRDLLREVVFPADYQTAVGERREVVLADGTRLQLNTDSAVDVSFDAVSRRIHLRRGEIHIVTARDPAGRPLRVDARDGVLIPVGTRFTVSQQATETLLGVSEGAVDVLIQGGTVDERVGAGWQLAFGDHAGVRRQPLDESGQVWTDGMISAENRRLDDFLVELARYRRGHLGCTPEAGVLRITGTWPLQGRDPSEAVLASLERHLPIRFQRLTRYWVNVDRR